MATTLFPTNVVTPNGQANTNPPGSSLLGVSYFSLSFARGSGVVSVGPIATTTGLGTVNGASGTFASINNENVNMQAGTTIEAWTGGSSIFFISGPLAAVAISGTITVNHRSLESAAQANYAAQAFVYRLPGYGPNAGVGATIGRGGNTTELGTAEAARSITITPIAGSLLNDGDRIMVVFAYGSPAGSTSASGRTTTFFYNGTTSAASGDSFITFTETIAAAKRHVNPAANLTHPTLIMEGMEQGKRNHLWLPKRLWRPKLWTPGELCPA